MKGEAAGTATGAAVLGAAEEAGVPNVNGRVDGAVDTSAGFDPTPNGVLAAAGVFVSPVTGAASFTAVAAKNELAG